MLNWEAEVRKACLCSFFFFLCDHQAVIAINAALITCITLKQ